MEEWHKDKKEGLQTCKGVQWEEASRKGRGSSLQRKRRLKAERDVKRGLPCLNYRLSPSRIRTIRSHLGLLHAITPSPCLEANEALQIP